MRRWTPNCFLLTLGEKEEPSGRGKRPKTEHRLHAKNCSFFVGGNLEFKGFVCFSFCDRRDTPFIAEEEFWQGIKRNNQLVGDVFRFGALFS